jgi:O-acetyl-ADP-ribose deacetylase (regulator of RNase III)
MNSDLRLILVDPQVELCDAFREYFKSLPNVEVINDYFENVSEFDCMVSAANSFRLMDGGVDAAIVEFFGKGLMPRVQERIIEEYFGEQPVGTSFIIETQHPKHPFVAHTPTMRVPMGIAHTDHVYLAMWAMLRTISHHNKSDQRPIRIIACPGLGTLTGGVPFKEAARQMSLAYKNFLNPPSYIDWVFADRRQSQILYGGDMGLRIPPRQ